MKTFLGAQRPIITTMLKPDNTSDLIRDIEAAIKEGTEGFCLQIDKMQTKYRTKGDFTDIFAAMQDKPAYIANYARDNVSEHEQSDEELTEEMLLALSCGATLFDIRFDLFDRQPNEICYHEKAAAKQAALAKEVHRLGGEVIFSAHPLVFLPYEEVYRILTAQQERGADIVKVVTRADNDLELTENLATTLKLKQELSVPFLFLCGGTHCRKHRLLGPAMGDSLFLTVQEGKEDSLQPLASDAKNILKTINKELAL